MPRLKSQDALNVYKSTAKIDEKTEFYTARLKVVLCLAEIFW